MTNKKTTVLQKEEKSSNFSQVPNKMFSWDSEWKVTNDELLVYIMLKAKMPVDQIGNGLKEIRTNLILVAEVCGFEYTEESRMRRRALKALAGLESKGYIKIDRVIGNKDNRSFTIQINEIDFDEVIEVDAPWSDTVRKFSGFTKIEYDILPSLLKNQDLSLFAYAEYRFSKDFNYRISYQEWSKVLGVSIRNVSNILEVTQVIIKIDNGYNKEEQKRETNSYLPFTRANEIEETESKPVFKNFKKESKSVEAESVEESKSVEKVEAKQEPVQSESVEEVDYENEEFAQVPEPAPTKRNTPENNYGIDDDKTLLYKNILKKIKDKRVTTVEQVKEITDFNFGMSVETYDIIKTTNDDFLKEKGNKKLSNIGFKRNFENKLQHELSKRKEKEYEAEQKELNKNKRFVMVFNDKRPEEEITWEEFRSYKEMKLIGSEYNGVHHFGEDFAKSYGTSGYVEVRDKNGNPFKEEIMISEDAGNIEFDEEEYLAFCD